MIIPILFILTTFLYAIDIQFSKNMGNIWLRFDSNGNITITSSEYDSVWTDYFADLGSCTLRLCDAAISHLMTMLLIPMDLRYCPSSLGAEPWILWLVAGKDTLGRKGARHHNPLCVLRNVGIL